MSVSLFQRSRKVILCGLTIGIVGVILSLSPMIMKFEADVGLHWLFRLRGFRTVPPEVVIVSIDKASADTLKLKNEPELWPRSLHGQLIDELHRLGAAVIVFSIGFDKPRPNPEEDEAFAKSITDAGNVILSDYIKSEIFPNGFYEQIVPPIALLKNAAVASAPFPLPRGKTDIQWVWTMKTNAGEMPTLPFVAFHLFARRTAVPHSLDLAKHLNDQHASLLIRLQRIVDQEHAIDDEIDRIKRFISSYSNDFDTLLGSILKTGLSTPEQTVLTAWINMYRMADSHFVNHYGSARAIPTIPYHQLIKQTLRPKSDFDGKAVFVGFSEDFKPEERLGFYNAFSRPEGINISEVEIAATSFSNLLEGAAVYPIHAGFALILVLLWGFLLTLFCHLVDIKLAALGTVLLAIGYLSFAQLHFSWSATWWPLVVPLGVQAPAAFISALLSQYRDVKRELTYVSEAFARFIPPEEVKKLAHQRYLQSLTGSGRLMQGVCLYTDIEEYTNLAEKMDPIAVKNLLNEYFEAIHHPITRFHGIISDTIGDAMLAIWATPQPDRNARTNACYAALAIQDTVKEFNQTSPVPLSTRIGLHYGEIALGHVGSVQHFEYRAIGDIVNTANRIEGQNKILGTSLLVSQEMIEQVDEFVTRELGSFPLRGKTSTVVLHELMCPRQEVTAEKQLLCDQFKEAQALFKSRRWLESEQILSNILTEYPADGPTRHYLERCRALH